MTKSTKVPAKQTKKLSPAEQTRAALDMIAQVPTINTAEAPLTPEQLQVKLREAKTAEEAFQILRQGSGLIPFANKQALAMEGTPFTIRGIGRRVEGAYDGESDDWAVAIVTADGEPFYLTFEAKVETRNTFLLGCLDIVQRFGEVPNVALQMYELDNEQTFYTIVPASSWQSPSGTETINA